MTGPRIFGIGLNRTGTSSLTAALERLGYRAIHLPTTLDEIRAHDAATDVTVAALFDKLDGLFPGSRFIYTVREPTAWITSCRRFAARREGMVQGAPVNAVMERLYDGAGFDEERYHRGYARHDARVAAYFADRTRDLLTLDLCAPGAGWEPLCRFLGRPVPEAPFPAINRFRPFDDLLIRLAHLEADDGTVGALGGVATGYVSRLRKSDEFRAHDPRATLPGDEGMQFVATVNRLCEHLGGAAGAAARVGLDPEFAARAVDLIARDRRARS